MTKPWTGKLRCVAKRPQPHPDSPDDCFYSFANVDSDGVMMQVIEDDKFCEVGDVVSIRLTYEKGKE